MDEAMKKLKLQQEDNADCIQEIMECDDLTQDEIAGCIQATNDAEDGDGMAEALEKLKLQQEVTNDAEYGDEMAEAQEAFTKCDKDAGGMVEAPEKLDLTEEEITDYKQAFTNYDVDGDGYIATNELGSLMRSLGRVIPAKDVEQIVRDVKVQENDKIDINVFLILMSRTKDADLKSTFKMLDLRGDGYIRSIVLLKVVEALFGNTTKYEIQQMIQIADTDGDGKLSYEEFAAAVKEGLKLKDC